MSTSSGSLDYGRFDELAEEFAGRYRRGERPSLQEYVDRLPEMAEEIREMFPALVEVERAEGDARGDPVASPARPHLDEIGDYRILREVGRGGMGVVYEAEQVSLGRRVALKVLPGHAIGDRKALERFTREAKAAARLHHTNIVPVFEVGRERDVSFYAMQLIQGEGLDQVIDELARLREPAIKAAGTSSRGAGIAGGPATRTQTRVAASVLLRRRELGRMAGSLLGGRLSVEGPGSPSTDSRAATGLVATERFDPHARPGPVPAIGSGIGDALPVVPVADASGSAVMPGGQHVSELDASGHRLPFFRGVAQIGRQAAQGLAHAHARGIVHRDIKPSNLLLDIAGVVWITDFGLAKADDDGITATGDILGTFRYMAPERFRGEGDARADLYALGLTLYELLTLRPAFESSDRLMLIERIQAEEPARPRSIDPRIPRDLETIVLKAIDKDPAARYANAEAMAEDLRRFLADEPILARQVGTTERYWRWARRNPGIATLGAVLTTVLVLATIGSLLAMGRFASLAESRGNSVIAERSARRDADVAREAADVARKAAEEDRAAAERARAAAQAETYRAMLSEVKALRAGHQPGWREEALANLARLAVMPTPRRDLVELRDEAVASLGEFDVVQVARFEKLQGTVRSLDFSPDSRTLATTTRSGSVDLWDVAGRQHSSHVEGPAAQASPPGRTSGDTRFYARFLPDGGLARIAPGHRVEFLDSSGRPSDRPPIGGTARAVTLEVDRKGRWLAVGWNDDRIDLRDAATGALRRSFRGNPWVMALSPDGRWLASPGPDDAARVRPTDGDGPTVTLGRHRDGIEALAFSPDGSTLAIASEHSVTLWDVARGEGRGTLRGHKARVEGLAFSPDGNWVATSSLDHTSRIWDARTGQTLAVLPGRWFMHAIAFSPDGQYLAASDNTAVNLYQIHGRRERRLLVGHDHGTQALAFHPRLARLASGADDHDVILWHVDSARPSRRRTAFEVYVAALAYSPDGSLLAGAAGGGTGKVPGEIRLWDAETGSLLRVLSGHKRGVHALAFDPTNQRLASGDDGGNLILWDATTGKVLRRESVGSSHLESIAFLDGGRRLVAGVLGGPIVLLDLEGTGPRRQVAVPGGMSRFAVDPARNDVIVAGATGILSRVSPRDLSVIHRLDKGHDGKIWSVALDPGGRLLATGGEDHRIVLRDAATFEPLATLPTWTGVVKGLAFDATGRWLAIAGADSDVGLWDLGLVREGLAALGLAWDRPAPSVASVADAAPAGERPGPAIPGVGPEKAESAELKEARDLIRSGIAAHREQRLADALVNLQRASEQLRALRRTRPGDPDATRQHGLGLRYLAICLRSLKRPGEALASEREGLAACESLDRPNPGDCYNMALSCARISAALGRGQAVEREEFESRAVRYLRRAIEGNRDRHLAAIKASTTFRRLRDRADYKEMMADATFPRDPFGPASRVEPPATKPLGAGAGP